MPARRCLTDLSDAVHLADYRRPHAVWCSSKTQFFSSPHAAGAGTHLMYIWLFEAHFLGRQRPQWRTELLPECPSRIQWLTRWWDELVIALLLASQVELFFSSWHLDAIEAGCKVWVVYWVYFHSRNSAPSAQLPINLNFRLHKSSVQKRNMGKFKELNSGSSVLKGFRSGGSSAGLDCVDLCRKKGATAERSLLKLLNMEQNEMKTKKGRLMRQRPAQMLQSQVFSQERMTFSLLKKTTTKNCTEGSPQWTPCSNFCWRNLKRTV